MANLTLGCYCLAPLCMICAHLVCCHAAPMQCTSPSAFLYNTCMFGKMCLLLAYPSAHQRLIAISSKRQSAHCCKWLFLCTHSLIYHACLCNLLYCCSTISVRKDHHHISCHVKSTFGHLTSSSLALCRKKERLMPFSVWSKHIRTF